MSADVIAFQKVPARTPDADFVRFNAATAICSALVPLLHIRP